MATRSSTSKNHTTDWVYPKDGSLNYVANGEIGIVVGQFKSKAAKWKPPGSFRWSSRLSRSTRTTSRRGSSKRRARRCLNSLTS